MASKEEKDLEAAIERIIAGSATKSDRARALFDLGCDRSEVVELLGMSYSQAHSIWKKRDQHADLQRRHEANDRRDPPATTGGLRDQPRASRRARSVQAPYGLARDADQAQAYEERPTFFLSPSQVRYVTQDGHVIVRVDTVSGPKCRHCDQPLTFSLQYLGFLHTYSRAEPTDVVDHYV